MNKYIEQEVAIKALMNDAPEKVEYSREDADSTSTERRMIMRLIDADEAIINFGFEWDDVLPTIEEFVRFLKKQPTVDAVEVVRCRQDFRVLLTLTVRLLLQLLLGQRTSFTVQM